MCGIVAQVKTRGCDRSISLASLGIPKMLIL